MKKKMMFEKIAVLMLVLVLSVSFVCAADDELTNLGDLDKSPAAVEKFVDLGKQGAAGKDERNELWEASIKNDGLLERSYRKLAVQEVVDELINKRIEADKGAISSNEAANIEKAGLANYVPRVLKGLKEKGITDFNVQVGKDASGQPSYATVSIADLKFEHIKALGKELGINLDIVVETKIEELIGFGNPALRWEEGNVIGDGKVWLNLESLPRGVTEIEYKDGKFFLRFDKEGFPGELVLSPGSTNEKGEIVALAKYPNRFADLNLPIDRIHIGSLELPVGKLENLVIEGKVILDKYGFKFTHESGSVMYGDLIFDNDFLSLEDSRVDFLEDRILIKGVRFERQGFLRADASEKETILYFGEVQEIYTRGDPQVVSFEDDGSDGNDITFEFHEKTGKLAFVKKAGFNKGRRVSVGLGLTTDTFLREIYEDSGDAVKSIIERANNREGDGVTFEELQQVFANDRYLAKNPKGLRVDKVFEGSEKQVPLLRFSETLPVREISYEDRSRVYRHPVESPYGVSVGGYSYYDKGRLYFRFGDDGALTHVKKEDTSWAPVSMALQKSVLGDVFENSGTISKTIIAKANKGEVVTYENIRDLFYKSQTLKRQGGIVRVDSYADNFISMYGENVAVGGKSGKKGVEISRSLNELLAVEGQDYKVNVGGIPLTFNGNELDGPRNTKGLSSPFNIDKITTLSGGKYGVGNAKTSFYIRSGGLRADDLRKREVEDTSKKEAIFDDDGHFVAGREVFVGPLRSSTDVHLTVDSNDLKGIKAAVGDAWSDIEHHESRTAFLNEMMDSTFAVTSDIVIPETSVKLTKDSVEQLVKGRMTDYVREMADKAIPIPNVGSRKAKAELIDNIDEVVAQALKVPSAYKGGKYSIEVRNEPADNTASLYLKVPGQDATKVSLTDYQAELLRDSLQITLRAPAFERGGVDYYTTGRFILEADAAYWSEQPGLYWPRSYLQRLWYNNLGKGSHRFDNLMYVSDRDYFTGELTERYTKENP